MTFQPIHILNQMGVITSFSVAKKVTEQDIKKFYLRSKKAGKTNSEIERLLRQKISNEIQSAVNEEKIPGIISQQELAKEAGINKDVIDNIPELTRLIIVISHKLSEKKYDKMSLCYFINSMVNVFGLTESDFEKFHQQNDSGEDDDNGEDTKDA